EGVLTRHGIERHLLPCGPVHNRLGAASGSGSDCAPRPSDVTPPGEISLTEHPIKKLPHHVLKGGGFAGLAHPNWIETPARPRWFGKSSGNAFRNGRLPFNLSCGQISSTENRRSPVL